MLSPTSTGYTMVEEIEIWRAANQFVKRYGEDARIEAAKRIDAMLEAGDLDGAAVWKRIFKAVEELQRAIPGSGEVAH